MVVKTYPSPSRKYGEITCTAGIRLRDGQWVRIYPYPFRLLEGDYRFQKYDILEMPLERAQNDPRPESFRLVDHRSIRKVDHIGTDEGTWHRRMEFIRPTLFPSLAAFEEQMIRRERKPIQEQSLFAGEQREVVWRRVWGRTIGVVAAVPGSAELVAQYRGEDWSEKEKAKLAVPQILAEGLFEDIEPAFSLPKTPLRFCPYQFRLSFLDATGKRYEKVVLDWEIYRLYFKEEQRLGSRERAVNSVRQKVEREIFSLEREPYLVVGSIHYRYARPTLYAVIGFIWPKKQACTPLF